MKYQLKKTWKIDKFFSELNKYFEKDFFIDKHIHTMRDGRYVVILESKFSKFKIYFNFYLPRKEVPGQAWAQLINFYDYPITKKSDFVIESRDLVSLPKLTYYAIKRKLKEAEESRFSGLSTTTLSQAKKLAKKLAKKYGIEYVVIYDPDTHPYGFKPLSIRDWDTWGQQAYRIHYSTEE